MANPLEYRRLSFVLGATVGILIAMYAAQPQIATVLDYHLGELGGRVANNEVVQSLLMNYIPSGDAFSSFFSDEESPGQLLKAQGVKPKHPVVLMPGFISAGLELWEGKDPCFKNSYRRRVWGTMDMLKSILMEPKCWMQHMSLDKTTGLDPESIRVRAAQGFDSADFIVGGFWVWAKVLDNLAKVGYDPTNMVFASHDWRLSPTLMEKRDRYFSKLVKDIEEMVDGLGERAVLVGHSMAAPLIHYLVKWAESPKGGNRGPDWVEKHIHSIVHIGGGFLGVPKALPALLSGEMRDTVQLGVMETVFLRDTFSAESRRQLWRTWNSVALLLPIGGDRVWGNSTWAPEDASHPPPRGVDSQGHWVMFRPDDQTLLADPSLQQSPSQPEDLTSAPQMDDLFSSNWTMDMSLEAIWKDLTPARRDVLKEEMFFGFAPDIQLNPAKYDHPRYWANVLSAPLPVAPSTKIFTLYGTGLPVERGYIYTERPGLRGESVFSAALGSAMSTIKKIKYDTDSLIETSKNKIIESSNALIESSREVGSNIGSNIKTAVTSITNPIANLVGSPSNLTISNDTAEDTAAALAFDAAKQVDEQLHHVAVAVAKKAAELAELAARHHVQLPALPSPTSLSFPVVNIPAVARASKASADPFLNEGVDEDGEEVSNCWLPNQANDFDFYFLGAHNDDFDCDGTPEVVWKPRLMIDKATSVPPTPEKNEKYGLASGVAGTDGDSTVPLLSLGMPSRWLWKGKTDFNPGNMTVVTREYGHQGPSGSKLQDWLEMRTGKQTGDHVDVLGNYELLKDLLLIVVGREEEVTERILSDVDRIVTRANLPVHMSQTVKERGIGNPSSLTAEEILGLDDGPNMDEIWTKYTTAPPPAVVFDEEAGGNPAPAPAAKAPAPEVAPGELNRDEL